MNRFQDQVRNDKRRDKRWIPNQVWNDRVKAALKARIDSGVVI
jgi:hypothetical protein